MACGTGIETCSKIKLGFHLSTIAECRWDPRNTWRSLTIAIDLEGNRVFSRMDSFQQAKVDHSSAEYIFSNQDGGHALITKEAYGMGFATIDPFSGELCEKPFGDGQIYSEFENALWLKIGSLIAIILVYLY